MANDLARNTTSQSYIKVVDANKREASKKITLTRQD